MPGDPIHIAALWDRRINQSLLTRQTRDFTSVCVICSVKHGPGWIGPRAPDPRAAPDPC